MSKLPPLREVSDSNSESGKNPSEGQIVQAEHDDDPFEIFDWDKEEDLEENCLAVIPSKLEPKSLKNTE